MPDHFYMSANTIGFIIGEEFNGNLPASNDFLVEVQTSYDEKLRVISSKLVVEIPLDLTGTSIFSPKDTNGNWHDVNLGEVGLKANNSIFDNAANDGPARTQVSILGKKGQGYINIKVPIVFEIKRDQISLISEED